MTTPLTTEERISRLEGVVQYFEVVMGSMVTREELQANVATLLGAIEGVKDSLRSEMRADIRAAEVRITRWTVGAIFTATALAVAAVKLLP